MRKVTEKSKRTRQHIFESAIQLFQEKGYDKTTMREISKAAGVALGLTYYHFATKEDLVFVFYQTTQEISEKANFEYCQIEKDFKKRLRNILFGKIEQFNPYSKFLHVLARSAGDPKNSLSPFSTETRGLRTSAIRIFEIAMENTNYSPPEDLRPILPTLLWFYQMGILYFWIFDSSEGKKKTILLIDYSLDLIFKLLRLSKLPFMKPIRRTIMNLFAFFHNAPEVNMSQK
jgi:AcrR family transcriptional regulator